VRTAAWAARLAWVVRLPGPAGGAVARLELIIDALRRFRTAAVDAALLAAPAARRRWRVCFAAACRAADVPPVKAAAVVLAMNRAAEPVRLAARPAAL